MIKKIYAILFVFSLAYALPNCGMENNIIGRHEITYPCDDCREEKLLLDYVKIDKNNRECVHILCTPCKSSIEQSSQNPTDNTVYGNCDYCSYFYHQKNKQCWQTTTDNLYYSLSATNQRAKRFKGEYPDRVLLDITHVTTPYQSTNNLTARAQILPNDRLQWLGAASIATIICYVAYQTATYF